MRHPPAFQIDVRVGRAWAWSLYVLIALSLTSLIAWALLAWQRQSVLWPLSAAALSVLIVIAFGLHWRRTAPRCLRWDGQLWFLIPGNGDGLAARQGELQVLLDFGDWLLLRFADASPHYFGRRLSYLALSRRDLWLQWHVLRSTIYSGATATGLRSSDQANH